MKFEEWRKIKEKAYWKVKRTLHNEDDTVNFVNPGVRRYPGCSTYRTSALGNADTSGYENGAYLVAANTLDFWKGESLRGGGSSGCQSTYFLPRGPNVVGPCREGCHCCEACSGQRDLGLLTKVLLAIRALGINLSFADLLQVLQRQAVTQCFRTAKGHCPPSGQEVTQKSNEYQNNNVFAKKNKENHICLHFAHGTPRCFEMTDEKERNKKAREMFCAANSSEKMKYNEFTYQKTYQKQPLRQLGKMRYEELIDRYSEHPRRKCDLFWTRALENFSNLVKTLFYIILVIAFLGSELANLRSTRR